MTDSPVRPLAEWTGRVLLLGAVAFWWGAIVIPRLVDLAFPDFLPSSVTPLHLNPDREGTAANAVSALFLLITALLAFANAYRSFDRWKTRGKRIATLGWTTLAATAAYLAWEEVSGFHDVRLRAIGDALFGTSYSGTLWPVLVSPVILAFVLTMAVFIRKELRDREVRTPLVAGLIAWILVIVLEVSFFFVFKRYAPDVERLLEETLEFGGTLLIGLSAGIALRGTRPPSFIFGDRLGLTPAVWSFDKRIVSAVAIVACVVALAIVAPYLGRQPLADARARDHVGTFHMSLYDNPVEEHSLIQELGVLPASPARLDLRVSNQDPRNRPGFMIWRMLEAAEGGSGRVLREGRMEVPATVDLSWKTIDFPPLIEAEGRPVALQLVADVEPEAHLLIGATKTNRFPDGRLWVNGELAWPDQNIEFVAYGAPELTRSKLWAMWHVFVSHWRWPVMIGEAAVGLTVVIFIPALLVTAALPRRSVHK